jgi:hypothetical protein
MTGQRLGHQAGSLFAGTITVLAVRTRRTSGDSLARSPMHGAHMTLPPWFPGCRRLATGQTAGPGRGAPGDRATGIISAQLDVAPGRGSDPAARARPRAVGRLRGADAADCACCLQRGSTRSPCRCALAALDLGSACARSQSRGGAYDSVSLPAAPSRGAARRRPAGAAGSGTASSQGLLRRLPSPAGLASAGSFAARREAAGRRGGPALSPGLPRRQRRRPASIRNKRERTGVPAFRAGGSIKAFWIAQRAPHRAREAQAMPGRWLKPDHPRADRERSRFYNSMITALNAGPASFPNLSAG